MSDSPASRPDSPVEPEPLVEPEAPAAPAAPAAAPAAQDAPADELVAERQALEERAAYDEESDGIDDPAPAPVSALGGHASTGATGVAGGGYAEPYTPAPQPQVVYVDAPQPPRPRSNRLFGVLMAIVGTVIFALVYLAVAAIIIGATPGIPTIERFVQEAVYWVPIMVFSIAAILLALLVNRARWWVHVLVSLVLALLVYFMTIGIGLLIGGVVSMTPAQAQTAFLSFARYPFVIVAALVAREVAMWVGLGVAARGRRVVARNVEARAAFDREQAERRAEQERAYARA
ncbi:hypothetical protein [Homoserinibacter sp. YIM 151385]|uniref:hypothetical protein n=1 Tax=Homoserinibacter sp. YIM 151385 TaxID=2985506 RepID=UPI0022F00206|nr:hypothetical protein [Homoserinibacter sp. YIM 151385]WBU37641.1 hypothetical protein OF852_12075 [Homoserinibacter sp. YIM 151385]